MKHNIFNQNQLMHSYSLQQMYPSDWRPGGCGFYPGWGQQHSLVEIGHEIFSMVILSLPLIQEMQLSVSGERMCTILVNRSEDKACPVNVWLGKLTALDMTPLGWLGHKTSTQTNKYSKCIRGLLYQASHKTSFQCLLCTVLRCGYMLRKKSGSCLLVEVSIFH